jgi:Protein of unknown function (DUF2934)
MSSKPRAHRRVEPQAMSTTQAEAAETNVADSARHQEIRIRAYEIYLERGGQHGNDLDDWILAEREIEAKVRSNS